MESSHNKQTSKCFTDGLDFTKIENLFVFRITISRSDPNPGGRYSYLYFVAQCAYKQSVSKRSIEEWWFWIFIDGKILMLLLPICSWIWENEELLKITSYQNLRNKLRLSNEKSVITNQCFKILKVTKCYLVWATAQYQLLTPMENKNNL